MHEYDTMFRAESETEEELVGLSEEEELDENELEAEDDEITPLVDAEEEEL